MERTRGVSPASARNKGSASSATAQRQPATAHLCTDYIVHVGESPAHNVLAKAHQLTTTVQAGPTSMRSWYTTGGDLRGHVEIAHDHRPSHDLRWRSQQRVQSNTATKASLQLCYSPATATAFLPNSATAQEWFKWSSPQRGCGRRQEATWSDEGRT